MDYKSYSVLDVFKYYFQTFRKDKDLIIVWFLLLQGLLNGAIPLFAVIFPKYIIDAISQGNLNDVIFYVLLFGFSSMLCLSIATYMRGVISGRVLASRVKKAAEFSSFFCQGYITVWCIINKFEICQVFQGTCY